MGWKFADELEREYRDDLKQIKRRLERAKERLAYLSNYKKECENQKKWDEMKRIRDERLELKEEIRILGSIVSSSMYSIEWLRDAREPGRRREISRQSRYQRTQHWSDMDIAVFNKFRSEEPEELSEEELRKLNDYLRELTQNEKDAIYSVIGKGNSYQETADFMGVSRSTVQSYVNRGMEKINNAMNYGAQTSLF